MRHRLGRLARAGALVLALVLGTASGGARAQAPRIGAPTLDPSGVVRWAPAPDSLSTWARGLRLPPATVADSLAAWQAVAERPGLRPLAAFRLAQSWLAAGDSVRADSLLAEPALAGSIWAWPALRERAGLSLARGDTMRADALLESADRRGWPVAECAAHLALRAQLRADLRDTARAIELARLAVRVYPSLPATGRALALLEALLRARGDSFRVGDQRAAAQVEVFAGRSAAAIGRLRRVMADPAAGGEAWRAGLRLCELLCSARRFGEARATADSLLREPGGAAPRERVWMVRARAELGAGRPDSALAIYARLAAADSLLPSAGWAAGRAAEDAGRWDESLRWYGRIPRETEDGEQAAFRAGLLHLALGRPDSAVACWAPDSSDGACFWHGVARRALGDTAAGDSLLSRVAAKPGYSFYRAAARDTLGLRGWPGGIAGDACVTDSLCGSLREVGALAGLGLAADAAQLLARWVAGDERLALGAREPTPPDWLFAARQAYAMGRTGLGISLAERAREAAVEPDDRQQWEVVPWAFPPAFESLFVAPRDTVVAALEPALLFALTRQESVFDPRARSRSDALGLMQLKLGTAADMARLARDTAPTEATLFDPERNVRYGARYLARLLRRFEGSVAAALSAYNAGPGSLSPRWRELRARGGEALLCELASNPLAQDYAKRILGYRQAYRELRPTLVER
jgi:soluble lytic murein transglycosylase